MVVFSSLFFLPFLPGSLFAKHKKWRRPGTSHQPDRQQPWWLDRKDHLCSDLRSRIISPSISCKKVRRLRFSFFCPPLLFVTLRSWTKVHFPLQLQSTAAKQTSAWRIAAAVRRINSGEDKSTVREQNPTWLQIVWLSPPHPTLPARHSEVTYYASEQSTRVVFHELRPRPTSEQFRFGKERFDRKSKREEKVGAEGNVSSEN